MLLRGKGRMAGVEKRNPLLGAMIVTAVLFVAHRLWSDSKEIFDLRMRLADIEERENRWQSSRPPLSPPPWSGTLHFSIRGHVSDPLQEVPPLTGSLYGADDPPLLAGLSDELTGVVDGVEKGEAFGWVCLRGDGTGILQDLGAGSKVRTLPREQVDSLFSRPERKSEAERDSNAAMNAAARRLLTAAGAEDDATPSAARPRNRTLALQISSLLVRAYVDGRRVSEGHAELVLDRGSAIAHICAQRPARDLEEDERENGSMPHPRASSGYVAGASFRLPFPPLSPGLHELRITATHPDGSLRSELHGSPLRFRESRSDPDAAEALRCKDALVLLRNAQLTAAWDRLRGRLAWNDGIVGQGVEEALGQVARREDGSAPDARPKKRLLAVLAVYSGLRSRDRRDVLRRTWFPTGEALRAWEEERGVLARFVIGGSDSQLDPVEEGIRAEAQEFGDILRLDVVDAYGVLSAKTLALFESLPHVHDADFYFKIDDDVAVNVPALVGWLETRRSEQDLYVGCMKSGAVIDDPRSKWYEPEGWRFGDPSPGSQQAAYPRHASGQLYGLSRGVARYLGHAAPLLKKYANEDTSVGAWLVGLNVTLVHEPRLCCSGQKACAGQRDEASLCLAYFEASCAGICNPERRLEPIYRACLEDPLGKYKGDSSLWKNKRAAP